jgi:hypothetical protein
MAIIMAILVSLGACVLCYAVLRRRKVKRKAYQHVIYVDPIQTSKEKRL